MFHPNYFSRRPHRFPQWFSCSVMAALAATMIGLPTATGETWTSLRGTHSVDARMVGLWDGQVILELNNGRRVSVKLNDLRSESRIQAQELARTLDANREQRVNDLKGQATVAAAPAPDPLPMPPAAPPYVPPQPNQPAANFLAQLDDAIAAGHLVAIYDSLPPSYRQDINEIVKVTAQRMDPTTWQGLVGTMQQLGDLMVTRQKWLLSSPRVQALPAEQQEMVEGPLLTLAGLLREGLAPEAMTLQQLQTTDFRQWLVERDQVIAPYLAQLFQQLNPDAVRQLTIESENNGTAVASVEANGTKQRITYVLVEGHWVPKSLADQWASSVQSWKEGADSPLSLSMAAASLVVQPIASTFGTLASAGNAGEFHEAMESVFTPAETIITTAATFLGRGTNRRGGGYDQMYEDYSDMSMEGMDAYEAEMMGSGNQFSDEQYRIDMGDGTP